MSDERKGAPVDDEELVHADDAIIGKAFRWSLTAILGLAFCGFVAFRLWRGPVTAEPVLPKEVGPIPELVQDVEAMPQVTFRDVAREAGITFVHESGARGEKLLPETMGGGVAFLDHDGDGDADLLFVNSAPWPGQAQGRRPTQALYRNDGKGRYEDVTAAAGLDQTFYGMGVATGDYDGDGDTDLFFAALGPNRLLRNDGGRFTEVTESAGVAGGDEWSSSAGFLDYDNDGDLDLFVCNYVRWSKAIDIELNFTLNGRDRAYGPPTNYEGTYAYLYRNDGGGRFTDVSAGSGVQVDNPVTGKPMAKALALTFVDVDRDGFLEIVVANDTVQNFLFHNRGNGTFEEVGAVSGVGFGSEGNATGAMGIDAAYYRNDGHLGIGIANFANEMTSFYVAPGPELQFTDEAVAEGIGAPSRSFLKFGLLFFDYDLDGRLDLMQANGHLENDIQQVQASQTYEQPAQLFWNAGPTARACFAEVPRERTGDLARPIVGRGAAYADIDADGDLDLVLTQVGGAPMLLRNEQALGRHWLRVQAVGPGGNRDAIGTWVEARVGEQVLRRQVMPTRSYLSQVELPVTFGLGRAERVDDLRVHWPDGTVQQVALEGVDRTVVVRHPRG